MTNYIADLNRFALAGPPEWFLKKLWDFDASLVIVPSRQACVYRLAQRRRLHLPEQLVNDALFNESDTKMLAQYSLVPVTSIIPTIEWADPYIFIELANRAPHRMGGAEKVIALVEGQEAMQDLRRAAAQDDMLNYLGKDAWGLYNQKIGLRSHMYVPPTSDTAPKPARKAPALRIKKAI